MRLLFSFVLTIFISIIIFSKANAACCAWPDKTACASCPSGYSSICVTKGDNCDCDCVKNASEAAEKATHGNIVLQSYITTNFNKIIEDTKRGRYHKPPGFPNLSITITPPE